MSKTITSPVEEYPGTVVLSDPITFPQRFAFEDAIFAMKKAGKDISAAHANALLLPGVMACVEKFEINGLPENPTVADFTGSPDSKYRAGANLMAWLINEVMALFKDAEEIPNA